MKRIELAECRRTIELLPWLANGSLEDAERRQVEAHLSDCGACRQEARFLEAFTNELPEPRPANDEEAPFGELLQRINRSERRRHTWKFAAAAILVVAVTAWLALPRLFTPGYVTVTQPQATATGYVHVQLVLAAPSDVEKLAELMKRHEATLLAGPDDKAAYLLEFPLHEDETAAELARRLEREANVSKVQIVESERQ